MILLNTKFAVDESLTKDVLFGLIKSRLEELDYHGVDADNKSLLDFDEIPEEYQTVAQAVADLMSIYLASFDDVLLYQQVSKCPSESASYTTRYVFNESLHQIQITKERHTEALSLSEDDFVFELPSLLKELFWQEYVGKDNGLVLDNRAYILKKNDVDWIKDVLVGKKKYDNVVVYVQATQDGNYKVNYDKIAQDLMGQAHVLVEGSPHFTKLISEAAKGKYFGDGEVFGYVALYHDGKELLSIAPGENFDAEIVSKVRSALSEIAISDEFNFIKLKTAQTLKRLGGDNGELSAVFESLLQDKDNEIEALKKQVDELKKEAYNSSVKLDSMQTSFDKQQDGSAADIAFGSDESDLYPEERKDVILKVLQKEYDMMKDDVNLSKSRKADVLKDVLVHNPFSGTDGEITKTLKGAFNDGALTREGIGCLRSLGFVVEKDNGGHYKIALNGDERYQGVYSSTTSDKARACKNFISDFTNILFGY